MVMVMVMVIAIMVVIAMRLQGGLSPGSIGAMQQGPLTAAGWGALLGAMRCDASQASELITSERVRSHARPSASQRPTCR
jgi:hypothetical protein